MVKKKLNPLKIDYQKCIIENRLLQIKSMANMDDIELIDAWSIDIDPQHSKQIVQLTREKFDEEEIQHIKRFKKCDDVLRILLCSLSFCPSRSEIEPLLQGVPYNNLMVVKIPHHGPSTKELSVQWSEKYWPLVWKGNPNDQTLNEYEINMDHVREGLSHVSQLSDSSELPIFTCMVDPTTNKIMALEQDGRNKHPLDHSIMKCIQTVARNERESRARGEPDHQYLCLNLHVYTTHEPCTMCAMALIHSRVKRLVFINPSPKCGALRSDSGKGFGIHNLKGLNSKYEVFQWLGDEYTTQTIDLEIQV